MCMPCAQSDHCLHCMLYTASDFSIIILNMMNMSKLKDWLVHFRNLQNLAGLRWKKVLFFRGLLSLQMRKNEIIFFFLDDVLKLLHCKYFQMDTTIAKHCGNFSSNILTYMHISYNILPFNCEAVLFTTSIINPVGRLKTVSYQLCKKCMFQRYMRKYTHRVKSFLDQVDQL